MSLVENLWTNIKDKKPPKNMSVIVYFENENKEKMSRFACWNGFKFVAIAGEEKYCLFGIKPITEEWIAIAWRYSNV